MLGAFIASANAVLVSLLTTPTFVASTQFFVSTRDASSTSDAYQGSVFSQQRVESYAQLAAGEALAERVVAVLAINESPRSLSNRLSAEVLPDTVLVEVSVEAETGEEARRIAAAVGDQFPRLIADLEASGSDGESPVRITVTDPPEVPEGPASPQTVRSAMVAGVAGALLGLVVALLRARYDRSVRHPEVAAECAGSPVIGTILQDEQLDKQHTIDRMPNSRTAEDYRQLRNNLQFLNVDQPPKVIMVTSALPSEGKTTAVVNLGLTLADAGQRVMIVEADLRKPKVARYLGVVGGVGLTNILAGSADLDDVVQRHGNGGLSVIASGPTPPNPGELLSSSHMATLLEKLRGANDYVLVDAPPLLPVADASGLAAYMDGVLISVRFGSTHKEQLQQAAATLERVGATTLGVILNIVPPKAELATAYGYGYSYQAGGPKHA